MIYVKPEGLWFGDPANRGRGVVPYSSKGGRKNYFVEDRLPMFSAMSNLIHREEPFVYVQPKPGDLLWYT
jgi:hypothetical protein